MGEAWAVVALFATVCGVVGVVVCGVLVVVARVGPGGEKVALGVVVVAALVAVLAVFGPAALAQVLAAAGSVRI